MAADLFFDLDRTLWDFDRNSREALALIYTEHAVEAWAADLGREAPALKQFVDVYEEENAKCWSDYAAGRLSKEALRPLRFERSLGRLGMPAGEVRTMVSEVLGTRYVEVSPQLPHLVPGARETVEALAERGHRMFILTNGFEEVQHIKVENSGLGKWFEAVYTSDALGHKKPHREAFELALSAAGSNARDAVMIGDDLQADVVGARAAGMRSVHFNPKVERHGEQVWRTVTDLTHLLKLPLQKSAATL